MRLQRSFAINKLSTLLSLRESSFCLFSIKFVWILLAVQKRNVIGQQTNRHVALTTERVPKRFKPPLEARLALEPGSSPRIQLHHR